MSEGIPKSEQPTMPLYMEEATGDLCDAFMKQGTNVLLDYNEENWEATLAFITRGITPENFAEMILTLPKKPVTYEYNYEAGEITIRPIKH